MALVRFMPWTIRLYENLGFLSKAYLNTATVPEKSTTVDVSHAMEAEAVCSIGAEDGAASRLAALLAPLPAKTAVDVSHWMFQTDQARRRLQMCGVCRAQSMFTQGEDSHETADPADL
ncbi:MAG: hypothetical protein ACREYF_08810 [Gammaproteobacteria bacterium]